MYIYIHTYIHTHVDIRTRYRIGLLHYVHVTYVPKPGLLLRNLNLNLVAIVPKPYYLPYVHIMVTQIYLYLYPRNLGFPTFLNSNPERAQEQAFYSQLRAQGLDLLITGHRHDQELWPLESNGFLIQGPKRPRKHKDPNMV